MPLEAATQSRWMKHVHERCVLVLTNSADATADYLCGRLMSEGIQHRRLDTDHLLDTATVAMGHGDLWLHWCDHTLCPSQTSAVIVRRPKPLEVLAKGDPHQRRHASDEWAEVVEGFLAHVPPERWINHPSRNFNASHKIEQLTRASTCGLAVPPWLVNSVPADAETFLRTYGPALIAKPLSAGYIERDRPEDDSVIYTCAVSHAHIEHFDKLPVCPVLFQQRVEKRVDVRLVVVGDSMAAVGLEAKDANGAQRLDIRRNEMQDVTYSTVKVPTEIRNGVQQIMAAYGLLFGAFDFAIDRRGQWVFFELNPNGQWAWLDLEGAADIGQLFVRLLRRM